MGIKGFGEFAEGFGFAVECCLVGKGAADLDGEFLRWDVEVNFDIFAVVIKGAFWQGVFQADGNEVLKEFGFGVKEVVVEQGVV